LNKLQTNITRLTSPNCSEKLSEVIVQPTQFLYIPQSQKNNLKHFCQKSSTSKIEQKHQLKENNQQVQDPVGGRLLKPIQAWEQIKAQDIILKGISADWISEESPQWLDCHKYIPPYKQNHIQSSALETLILKELQENIIVEVNGNQLKWLNPIFAIPKKGKAGWRKIMDCKRLNSHLQCNHFKMEDIKTLRELIRPGDWIIKLDLESAFNHITVEPNFRPFLGFEFKGRFYMYTAMCFGVRHAPLIFHKTMRPLMKYLREKMNIRSISYCDDLIFMNENKEVLALQALQIVQIIQEFGWKISQEKSSLIPTQSCEFLGWSVNSLSNELTMTSQRREEMLRRISKWRRMIQSHKSVKTRWLASLIGKFNFLRIQIKRGGLHLKKLNKLKNKSVEQKGWNCWVQLQRTILPELFWWRTQIIKNNPIRMTFTQPEVVLRMDASLRGWGGTMTKVATNEQIKIGGNWKGSWRLTSSNQRELAAILCGIRFFREELRNWAIQQPQNRNRQLNSIIQHQQRIRSDSFSEDAGQNLADCRKQENVDISNAYTREEQSSRRFTIETCNERGLLNSARSTGRRTATAE
ncbi:MAG: putative reverse transcriptase, partial [Streblomastix strix]